MKKKKYKKLNADKIVKLLNDTSGVRTAWTKKFSVKAKDALGMDKDDLTQMSLIASVDAMNHYKKDGPASLKSLAYTCIVNQAKTLMTKSGLGKHNMLQYQSTVEDFQVDNADPEWRLIMNEETIETLVSDGLTPKQATKVSKKLWREV